MVNHRWAIDIDGVITANPAALSWLTYHLCKDENTNEVLIITWRDGSNPERVAETIKELAMFGISYHDIIFAPRKFKNARVAAYWKASQVAELKINTWVDDELKSYKRDFGIDLEKLLPEVNKIWI